MVTAEQRNLDNPKICVVTRGGVHTRGDASTSNGNQQPWVCKVVKPPQNFDPVKEKKTYEEAQNEIKMVEWSKTFP